MMFNCPKCKKNYRIDPKKIDGNQCHVRCKQCDHEFWVIQPTHVEKIPIPISIYSEDPNQLSHIQSILESHNIHAVYYASSESDNNPLVETESDSDSVSDTKSQPILEFQQESNSESESESESDPKIEPESEFKCEDDSNESELESDLQDELSHDEPSSHLDSSDLSQMGQTYQSIQAQLSNQIDISKDALLDNDNLFALDVGTCHLVFSGHTREFGDLPIRKTLNAFFTIPESGVTKNILNDKQVLFFSHDHLFYILGDSAQSFANIFNQSLHKPMERGFISPNEKEGFRVIEAILNSMLPPLKMSGQLICYGIPGNPPDDPEAVIYHETMIHRYLETLGFNPIPVNEGLATVMAELQQNQYTGIGISFGGGMCNVCFAYYSVPIVTFSIQKGGDYIDAMVGKAVGESIHTIKLVKENELTLCKTSDNRLITALYIYYEELIKTLLDTLQRKLEQSNRIPVLSSAVPIVLSGGTAVPNGFKELFETILAQTHLPIAISQVRVAENPLHTTVKGLLQSAKLIKEHDGPSNYYLLR